MVQKAVAIPTLPISAKRLAKHEQSVPAISPSAGYALKNKKNLCAVTQIIRKVLSRRFSFTSQELPPLSNHILDLGDIQLESS